MNMNMNGNNNTNHHDDDANDHQETINMRGARGGKRKSRGGDEEEQEDPNMKLSRAEHARALRLRAKVLALSTTTINNDHDDYDDYNDEDLADLQKSISDMEYAQYSIICGGDDAVEDDDNNVNNAGENDNNNNNGNHDPFITQSLERIRKVHRFRKQYQINNTVSQGVDSVQQFLERYPGFSLDINQCPRNKHYVHVLDFGNHHPKLIKLENDWKIFMRGIYYMTTALQPNLAATRRGIVVIFECDGMGFHNFCLEFERRLWYECPSAYPFKFYEVNFVHTPTALTVFHSLMKRIWPKHFKTAIHLGVNLFGDNEEFDARLDTIFNLPTKEIAIQRQINTVQTYLTERLKNQSIFQL